MGGLGGGGVGWLRWVRWGGGAWQANPGNCSGDSSDEGKPQKRISFCAFVQGTQGAGRRVCAVCHKARDDELLGAHRVGHGRTRCQGKKGQRAGRNPLPLSFHHAHTPREWHIAHVPTLPCPSPTHPPANPFLLPPPPFLKRTGIPQQHHHAAEGHHRGGQDQDGRARPGQQERYAQGPQGGL